MTSVFDHAWMTGLFGDKRVAEHLSAEVQLAHMLRIEAAHSRLLGNESAACAIEATHDHLNNHNLRCSGLMDT